MERTPGFSIRPALVADVPALDALIEHSARALSVGFYTQQQTEAVTRHVFGVDSQLVEDGTYYAVEAEVPPDPGQAVILRLEREISPWRSSLMLSAARPTSSPTCAR
jgi:hypothetical protein